MTREKLIEAYENMMCEAEEFDVWEDDIQPKLETMTTAEIKKWYIEDKQYYSSRATMEQH